MIITYYDVECFKIQQGDLTLVFNPVSKQSSAKAARFGADIALVSANHPDMNGWDEVSYGGKTPFVIKGPGEYEKHGVFVQGLLSKTSYGGEEKINTVYDALIEGTHLLFLGPIDAPERITKEIYEAVDDVDILFVPVGGTGVLAAAPAYKVSLSFSPKMIIPMHYDAASLSTFLKEAGAERAEPQEKITLKKKDLEGKEGAVVVLKPTRA